MLSYPRAFYRHILVKLGLRMQRQYHRRPTSLERSQILVIYSTVRDTYQMLAFSIAKEGLELMARKPEGRKSDSGLSAMLIYHATIIIHGQIIRLN